MNAPIRKSLFAAAVSLLLAAPLEAQSVYLNGDGIGQALIYPYYTAQSSDGNPFNTLPVGGQHQRRECQGPARSLPRGAQRVKLQPLPGVRGRGLPGNYGGSFPAVYERSIAS